MNQEEKKATNNLKELSHYCSLRMLDIEDKNSDTWANFVVDIQIVKNLIEKQDKIINEMADYICEYDENHYTGERLWKSREQVIEYFTKKVGE